MLLRILTAGAMIFGTSFACGQDYPIKPIRIMTTGIGGGADFIARLVAQGISAPLGQPVVVENRPSAVVPELVAKAPPDGYTLQVQGSVAWLTPLLRPDAPYDGLRDFAPISWLTMAPNILVAHPSLPVNSIKQLIALAKARPGELNFGASGGAGGSTHLSVELFKAMAGVNVVLVPFKGGAAGINELLAGEVHMTLDTGASLMPHVKIGKLKALAVTSAQPSSLYPNLPTIAATVPGYESISLTTLLSPARTPASIVQKLNQQVVRLLNQADVRQRILSIGVEPVGSSPEQLSAFIKTDIARWAKVIKDAGIKAD